MFIRASPSARMCASFTYSLHMLLTSFLTFFFFNDTATTEIYTLSLHDALPIYGFDLAVAGPGCAHSRAPARSQHDRSEEHTSELQSPCNLVCRLLLEKKKNNTYLPQPCVTLDQAHRYHSTVQQKDPNVE